MNKEGVSDLISQYMLEYENIQELRKQKDPERDEEEIKILESMARELRETVEYMETGQYKKTGEILVGGSAEIDRLFVHRGLWDSGNQNEQEEPAEIDEVHYDFKSILSNREYLCLLAYERGMSIRKIAAYIEVAASTVQSYIERARKKLNSNEGTIQLSLFDDSTDVGA